MRRVIRWRIKEALAERNMLQKELAERTRIAESQISRMVNNKLTRVDLATIERLCAGLGNVQVNQVIEFVPDP